MTRFPTAPRSLCAALGLLAGLGLTPAARAQDAPPAPPALFSSSAPVTPSPDVVRAQELFTRLVAREAAFDPTTKHELYADSATFDFSLQYADGTVAPIPMTLADVRKAAAQSMAIARQQGIAETYADAVYTPLGDGRVRVDCHIVFSDGGPDSTMSQVMGPDPASGRFLVLAETVRMVEKTEPEDAPGAAPGNGNGPGEASPAGPVL